MWYISIADDKGERFNPVPGVIQYLTAEFTKRDCWYPKLSYWFVMSFQIIISLEEDRIINRTIDPTQLLLLSRSGESSVMWYLYIADENGERFNILTA